MSNVPIFLSDPAKQPTFLPDSFLILTTDYRGESHNFTTSFGQGQLCTVIACGLSKYVLISEQGYNRIKVDDGIDWCHVEACETGYEPAECCVKDEHLREMTAEDNADLYRRAAIELRGY